MSTLQDPHGAQRTPFLASQDSQTRWICKTFMVQYPKSVLPPAVCTFCQDDRELMPAADHEWITPAQVNNMGYRSAWESPEVGVWRMWLEPQIGIDQPSVLICTPEGNVLWDPPGWFDRELEE
ncbi:hypothetical protein ABT272_45185, partial [Streptomyces sp900105245]